MSDTINPYVEISKSKERHIAELEAQLAKCRDNLSNSRTNVEIQQMAADKAEDTLAELAALYSAAVDVMEERGNKILELEAELAEQRDLNKKFRMLPDARIAELEAELAETTTALIDATKEADRYRTELAVEVGENQRLRDALGSLSNEFDRMHTMVSSRYVAERLQALERDMSGPDVEERHAASLALLELKDKRIAELEAENQQRREDNVKLALDIASYEDENQRLKHELEVLRLYGNKTVICEEAVLAENQRLRDAINLIHERLRLAYSLTYDITTQSEHWR